MIRFRGQAVKCQGQEFTTGERNFENEGTTVYRVGHRPHICLQFACAH